jgi:hypothetical protein
MDRMKIGDKVRLVRVPKGVRDDGEFKTKTLFKKCVGQEFTVKGFQLDGGRFRREFTRGCWVELHISEFIPGLLDSIWIEPYYLTVLPKKARAVRTRAR